MGFFLFLEVELRDGSIHLEGGLSLLEFKVLDTVLKLLIKLPLILYLLILQLLNSHLHLSLTRCNIHLLLLDHLLRLHVIILFTLQSERNIRQISLQDNHLFPLLVYQLLPNHQLIISLF